MMNHLWALLIFFGVIIGVYNSTRSVANPEEYQKAKDKYRQEQLDAAKDDKTRAVRTAELDAMTEGQWKMRIIANKGKALTDDTVSIAETAVKICIGYISMMALWLGIMRVAEDAGLISVLARSMSPLMRFLFPRIPADHPASGAMLMNIAANMLGLDNAATPLGLKAMRELQALNKNKDTATDSMIMFLAINTSSVTLVPFSIFAYRSLFNSANPQVILGPATLATFCSTAAAIIIVKITQRFLGSKDDYYEEWIAGDHRYQDAENHAKKE
ncbi:MAG: nucleoside recognition domain-containing protein [bacterium]